MANEGHSIKPQRITAELFRPFGNLLALKESPDKVINQGMCDRHHDLADIDVEAGGKSGISLFNAKPRALPYRLEMMERHPKGSQAFIPMYQQPFLVTVAIDKGGMPDVPIAFLTKPHMGINFYKNIWHGVLTPLKDPGIFAVIDRISTDDNLEEYWFNSPYIIEWSDLSVLSYDG